MSLSATGAGCPPLRTPVARAGAAQSDSPLAAARRRPVPGVFGEARLGCGHVEHRELRLDPIGEQVEDSFSVGESVEEHDRDRAPRRGGLSRWPCRACP